MSSGGAIGPINHGHISASWSPSGGGTLEVTRDKPRPVVLATGLAATGAASFLAFRAASKASKVAVDAARSAGVQGAALMRVSTKAGAPGMLGMAAIAGAGTIATHLIGKQFTTEDTVRKPMSRESFIGQGFANNERALNPDVPSYAAAAGMVTGIALGGAAQYALAGAPKYVQLVGALGGLVGGMLGGMTGVLALSDKLKD